MKTLAPEYATHSDDITGNRSASRVRIVPTNTGRWRYDGPDGTRLALEDSAAALAATLRDRQADGVSVYYPPLDQISLGGGDYATAEKLAEWEKAIASK